MTMTQHNPQRKQLPPPTAQDFDNAARVAYAAYLAHSMAGRMPIPDAPATSPDDA